MAVDACEELLQEVDITPFLLALCGHTRGLPHAPPSPGPLSPGPFSSSIEEGPEPRERAVLASESRLGLSWSNVEEGTQSSTELGSFDLREWPGKVALKHQRVTSSWLLASCLPPRLLSPIQYGE